MIVPGLLKIVVESLDYAGIPHMLVGSFASTTYGMPRSTQDIDLVIDPTPDSLDRFVTAFDPDRFYVGPSPQVALANRDQFNVIDPSSGWKVDLIIRKDRGFSREEFERRLRRRIGDVDVFMETPEDTVLSKLEWASVGGSERQVADAASVLRVHAASIDNDYLDRWAAELGISELLAQAREQ